MRQFLAASVMVTTAIPVQLSLRAGAPPLRSLHLLPTRVELDRSAVSDSARIEVQGHPASSSDPPCATP